MTLLKITGQVFCRKAFNGVFLVFACEKVLITCVINPEYPLEILMVKLKLQYFGQQLTADSLEKTLMPGKIEGRRRRGQQRMRRLDGITDSVDMSLSKLQKPGVLQSMGLQSDRTERLNSNNPCLAGI